ncbi:Uncharacterised protein [Halioglobus japonicus]|nr:Uncharacterised protein [Halioglobus japonicus]
MSARERWLRKQERSARLAAFLAARSSRNKSLSDKICRYLVNRATAVKPEDDFMRDPLIDNDMGFDPDELDRFQRGE